MDCDNLHGQTSSECTEESWLEKIILKRYLLFQSVHKAMFKGHAVAVKRVKENSMSEDSFIEEAKTMT